MPTKPRPKISLTITRENGHTTKATTKSTHPPTAEMLADAEKLLEHLSTGKRPAS